MHPIPDLPKEQESPKCAAVIAGKTFKTKKELKAFCRSIREAAPLETPLDRESYRFLIALLNRHPDSESRIGCGVDFFFVRINNCDGFLSRGWWLQRTDGTQVHFRENDCITLPKNRSSVMRVCRDAVELQIRVFRQQNGRGLHMTCPISGEIIFTKAAHVDHEKPTFEQLVETWLNEEGLAFEQVKFDESSPGAGLADKELEQRWKAFHYQHAKLRLVSEKANLSLLRRRKPDCPKCGALADIVSTRGDEHIYSCEGCGSQFPSLDSGGMA